MPSVVREDLDKLNSTITVKIEKGDYTAKFNTELNKYQQQAHMKGFRKGKTPKSVLKKMYGRPLLAEIVNEMLQKELFDFIEKEKMDILGQPIPNKEQELIDFNLKDMGDYTFKFDLGLSPEFDLQGVGKDNSFEKYAVEVPDNEITEELNMGRKRLGERVQSEDVIQENDLLKLEVVEVENGAPKAEGIEAEFSVLVENLTEDAKAKILSAQVGDTLELNLFELEKDTDEKRVRKYFLQLEDEDEREVSQVFSATIKEASHIEDAELNEAFFEQYFGDDSVKTEEEAREKIRENIRGHYDKQAEALLFRDVQEDLMEKNQQKLPDEFLKRWLKVSNEKLDDATIEKEYEGFAKNLQWTIIRNKLIQRFELKVEEQDIIDGFKDRVRGYFAGSPMADDSFLDNMVMRLMQDEKQVQQVYDELMTDRLYEALEKEITVEDKAIAKDDFMKIVEEAQAKAQAAQALSADASEEE